MPPREKPPTKGSREREIDRLEKDVEDLRHLAGSADGEAEIERIRQQVADRVLVLPLWRSAWQRQPVA